MAASDVPLKIRIDIRDLWDSPKAPLQASISALETTLGHKIVPIVRWPVLWDALKDHFPDKETFVPTISRVVIAWYERLLFRLETDNFAEWTEKFLTLLSQSHSEVQLHIEPPASSHVSLQTIWQANSGTFHLDIEVAPQARVVAALDQGFDVLFAPTATTPIIEDGWDDVVEGSTSKSLVGIPGPNLTEAAALGIAASLDASPREIRLPRINELSRPNDLFVKMTPYIMTIDFEREGSLLVKSSHEPSLQLLVAYFDRWGRVNPNDTERKNIFKFELLESTLCSGVMDALLIHTWPKRVVNPTLILAFVEGTLGYKLVYTNGQTWVYRSDSLFK